MVIVVTQFPVLGEDVRFHGNVAYLVHEGDKKL
jgi:hypothetical protein